MATFDGILAGTVDAPTGVSYRRPIWYDSLDFNTTGTGWESGESLIGDQVVNQPIDFLPERTITGILSPTFSDDFYHKTRIIPPALDVGNVITDQTREFTVWNGHLVDIGLQSLGIEGNDGINIDIPVPDTFLPLEEKIYTAEVSGVGNPSIDAYYEYIFVTGESVTVRIYGQRISFFPWVPKPGMAEHNDFMTEIHANYDGTEQRIRKRQNPRHQFDMSIDLNGKELGRIGNYFYKNMNTQAAVPLWYERRLADADISATDETISVSTLYSDFRVGGLCVAFQDIDNYEVFLIESMDDNNIVLNKPAENDLRNPWIMPVRNCRYKSNPIRETNGFTGLAKISFTAQENYVVSGFVSDDVYKTLDVYKVQPELPGRRAPDTYTRRVDMLDNRIGIQHYTNVHEMTKIMRKVRFTFDDLSSLWDFRLFFNSRVGRLKTFYMPDWERTFIPISSTGIVYEVLDIVHNEMPLTDFRENIAFLKKDGTWLYREVVTVVEVDKTTLRITLDDSLDTNMEDFSDVMPLGLKRFAQDKVKIIHGANNKAVCDIAILEILPS